MDHRATMLPTELLYYIFQSLDARSLTTVACVCSAWSETAVHIKWNTMKVPLRDLLNVYVPMKKPAKTVLYLAPKEDAAGAPDKQWNRMSELAGIVRHLVMDRPIKTAFRKHLETRLKKPGKQYLCAHLQSFAATNTANIIPTCQLLLGPSLRQLKLTVIASLDYDLAALEAIANVSPRIDTLSLVTNDSYPPDAITGMKNIRTLNIQGYFSFDTWSSLAKVKHKLEHVTFKDVFFDPYINAPSSRLSLPYIQSLDFEKGDDPEAAMAILRNTHMAGLSKILLSLDDLSNADCAKIMENLKQCAPCLEDLSIGLGLEYEMDQATELSYTCFTDLNHLRHLRVISINIDLLNKENLKSFATRLPNLETFHWESSLVELYIPNGIPVDLVEVLAQSWKSLRHLNLSVDASGFDPESPPRTQAKFTSVEDFALSLSGFADHLKPLAQWISSMFPNGQARGITMQKCSFDKWGRVQCVDTDMDGERYDNMKLKAMIQAYQAEGPDADELAEVLYQRAQDEDERKWATGYFDELLLRLQDEADDSIFSD